MQRSTNLEQYQQESQSSPALVTEILKEMNNEDISDMNEQNHDIQDQPNDQMHQQMEPNEQMQPPQQMQHPQQMQPPQQMEDSHQQDESHPEIMYDDINRDINNNNHVGMGSEEQRPQQEQVQLIQPPTIKEIRENKSTIDQLQDPLKVMAIFILLSLPVWDKFISAHLGKFIASSHVLSLSIMSLKGILAGIIFYIAKRFV